MSYSKKLKTCGLKVNVEFFNNCNELVSVSSSRTHKGGSFDNARTTRDKSFTGVENFDEALKLLKDGWSDEVKKLESKLNSKLQGKDSKRISFKNDVQGFAPVVPLALQGVPNSMINTHIKPIKSKIINVFYDNTCACRVKFNDIISNGIKLVSALIDLELQGYRINLYAISSSCDDNTSDVLVVKIKDANQPFALQRMMFPVCHSGFSRVIGFDWYERNPDSIYRFGYGKALGYYLTTNKDRAKFFKDICGDGTMILLTEILNKNEQYIKEVLTNGSSKD